MTEPFLTLGARLAVLASGCFLLAAILTGGWKYRHVRRNPDHKAPVYVNIAHQAALAYAFSCLVVASLAQLSIWPEWVNTTAVILSVYQFLFATTAYIVHGFDRKMKNQFAPPHRLGSVSLSASLVHGSMMFLFVCEFSGVAVLLAGTGFSLFS